jgi:DNA mismatch repair ATPase MutL
MKLTRWLFENDNGFEEELSIEEQVGFLSDYITGELNNVFPSAKLEKETDGYVLWNLENKIKLMYRFATNHTRPTIVSYVVQRYINDNILSEYIQSTTYESFKKQLTVFFKKLSSQVGKIFQYDRFSKQIKQEMVDYFGSNIVKTDETGVYIRYKVPNTMVKFEAVNNQTKLSIRYKTVDHRGDEDIAGDFSMILGEDFRSKMIKHWDWIDKVLENTFGMAGWER